MDESEEFNESRLKKKCAFISSISKQRPTNATSTSPHTRQCGQRAQQGRDGEATDSGSLLRPLSLESDVQPDGQRERKLGGDFVIRKRCTS